MTHLIELQRPTVRESEQPKPLSLAIADKPAEQNDTRLAVGVVMLKAAALLCGAYLLMDDYPVGAAVCLGGSIFLVGILAIGLARRRP